MIADPEQLKLVLVGVCAFVMAVAGFYEGHLRGRRTTRATVLEALEEWERRRLVPGPVEAVSLDDHTTQALDLIGDDGAHVAGVCKGPGVGVDPDEGAAWICGRCGSEWRARGGVWLRDDVHPAGHSPRAAEDVDRLYARPPQVVPKWIRCAPDTAPMTIVKEGDPS